MNFISLNTIDGVAASVNVNQIAHYQEHWEDNKSLYTVITFIGGNTLKVHASRSWLDMTLGIQYV